MPTYDYLCDKCGHRFDEIQKMSDPPLTRCPECKGKVKRVISGGVGVVFKGSGFYVTDSRSASTAKAAGASKETSKTETPAAAAKETKTESTPKTETKKGA